jgi:hypothetical protein
VPGGGCTTGSAWGAAAAQHADHAVAGPAMSLAAFLSSCRTAPSLAAAAMLLPARTTATFCSCKRVGCHTLADSVCVTSQLQWWLSTTFALCRTGPVIT